MVSYEGGAGLDAAWTWALEISDNEQSASGFWIGYTFTRLMCENCFTGTYYDSDWNRLPTLGELVTGQRVDDDFRTLRDLARRKLSDRDGGGRIVPKDIAVLVKFDRNGSLPKDVDMTNMSLAFDIGNRPLLWLGHAGNVESIRLLRSIYESRADGEARKGAIWAVGMHDEPDQVVPFLAGILKGDESVELRKSAAYGLGNQRAESAHHVLREAALSEENEELAKAAVYAMGNALDDNDVSPLLDVMREARSIEVRKAAVYAVGNADGSAAVAALKDVIENESGVEVRKAAVYALGNMDSAEAKRVLLALIGNIR